MRNTSTDKESTITSEYEINMNEKLQKAEKSLLEFVDQAQGGVTMDDILAKFGDTIGEAELRAAVWTLRADGVVDFDDGKLRAQQLLPLERP